MAVPVEKLTIKTWIVYGPLIWYTNAVPYNQTMSSNVIDCHIIVYSLFTGNREDHMLKISLQQLYSWYTHQNVATVIPSTLIGIITVIHVTVNHNYYDSRHDFNRPESIITMILIIVKIMVMIPDMILKDQLESWLWFISLLIMVMIPDMILTDHLAS